MIVVERVLRCDEPECKSRLKNATHRGLRRAAHSAGWKINTRRHRCGKHEEKKP